MIRSRSSHSCADRSAVRPTMPSIASREAGGRFVAYRDPPDDADPAVATGFAIIRDSLKFARDFPPAAAMARMFERVGLTASAATTDHAGTRAGNTLLALALARRASAGGSGFAEIVDELD